jgi:hypothetical protein
MAVPAGTARTKNDDENDEKGLKRRKVRKREFLREKTRKKEHETLFMQKKI